MNHYAEAIRILEKEGINYKALMFEVARKSPAVLMKAARAVGMDAKDWRAECRNLFRGGYGYKINAIKLYREKTGANLKEAKEAVEAM